ncbi:MAG TPA: nickel-dependent hydrogenase large subunit [Candidatus Bathyarchaeia archaeon]|nr:nickel-dependent hydrogenase large subunit [Candidatus Bathyarchaeia archaeon]
MATTTIDPLTRVEGHLKIKIEVSGGLVSNAWSSGLLFRGFETILQGRDPRDAPALTARICGVCHAVHRLTSIQALENAAGVVPPPEAVRIRNIIQGVNFIYSHAAHIFVLAGPDYDLYGLVPGLSEGKNQDAYNSVLKTAVLPAQRLCHEIGAIFGGKTPHHMTTVPGGVTCVPTQAAIDLAMSKLGSLKSLVGKYFPAVHSYLDSHRSELQSIGRGCGNFIAYGVFADPAAPTDVGRRLLKRGVLVGGQQMPFDEARITEAVRYSWYTDDSGGTPSVEPPPQPSAGKSGAYSWIKAPRYGGIVCEAGPLARMIVSGRYPNRSSLYDRLKARVLEAELVLKSVERWIHELKPGSGVYRSYVNPGAALGIGLWEAPRGANGHWVAIEGGRISHYQVVPPTNWNASPRDDAGQPGPIEQAIIGTPEPDEQRAANTQRIVRSFDPCIACSVH